MNVLEVRDLHKTYPAFALKGISLDVPQGAIVGFIGRNGAGKSTTLKSVLGLVHPDGGTVRVFGMDYAANEAAIRQRLGVVLGGIDFYPKKKLRIITDVTRRFYGNWDEEKYRHYLELFAIDEDMIALALSHNAELLLLDEPTSGLDPVSRDELVELFRRIVADGSRSILFSTHITSDLEKCASHIAFIKDGELLFDGSAADFRAHFRDKGETLEEIIVAIERRALDEDAII